MQLFKNLKTRHKKHTVVKTSLMVLERIRVNLPITCFLSKRSEFTYFELLKKNADKKKMKNNQCA